MWLFFWVLPSFTGFLLVLLAPLAARTRRHCAMIYRPMDAIGRPRQPIRWHHRFFVVKIRPRRNRVVFTTLWRHPKRKSNPNKKKTETPFLFSFSFLLSRRHTNKIKPSHPIGWRAGEPFFFLSFLFFIYCIAPGDCIEFRETQFRRRCTKLGESHSSEGKSNQNRHNTIPSLMMC